MTTHRIECPACRKPVGQYPSGRLYNHRTPEGSKCFASGADPVQFASASKPPSIVECVFCHRTVKLRQTGSPEVIGTMWKHRAPDEQGMAQWCMGGGELPYISNATDSISAFSMGTSEEWVPSPKQGGELAAWWRSMAERQIRVVVPKAIQYGATDLRDIGRDVYEMAGRPMPDDPTAVETGIAFYIRGKVARAIAAIKEDRQPSYDTWLDVAIYATMAMRTQTHGGWPGSPDYDEDED